MNNTLIFGDALEALKNGARIARKGWNGKGMYLFLAKEIEFTTEANLEELDGLATDISAIAMRTANKDIVVGWLASQTDMLAEDWEIL